MIKVTGVTKAFATGNSEVRAVDNVDLDVAQGDFVMILGRSGSGKSTLLGMLSGLIRPSSGGSGSTGRKSVIFPMTKSQS